jgi:hypothetical protein
MSTIGLKLDTQALRQVLSWHPGKPRGEAKKHNLGARKHFTTEFKNLVPYGVAPKASHVDLQASGRQQSNN